MFHYDPNDTLEPQTTPISLFSRTITNFLNMILPIHSPFSPGTVVSEVFSQLALLGRAILNLPATSTGSANREGKIHNTKGVATIRNLITLELQMGDPEIVSRDIF